MANKVLASASFADDFLYVQLSSNPNGSLGHLYAIKTSKGPNIVYTQPMTPFLDDVSNGIAVSSVSMAVLAVTPPMGRNPTGQVFFALNSLQGSQGQGNGAPFMAVRYSKNSALDEYSAWNLDKIPLGAILPLPNSATKLWFAPGMALPMNTGGSYVPAIYQLYLEPAGTVGLWIVQVPMGSSVPGTLLYRSSITLDGTMDPQIVSLPGDADYDAVIIGKCANANNTCLVFVRSQQTHLVTTTIPYDPTNCFAAANGSVIMASSTSAEVNQIKYPSDSTPQPPSNGIPSAWDRQLTLNSSAPGSILACAARGSTFYAVQRGDGTQPTIRTITLNPNPNKQPMSWQTMTLVPGITDNVDHNPNFKSFGLSGAAIAGIIVAVIALLVAAGFFWRRSIKSKKGVLQGPGMIPPPLAPQPASTATYAAYNVPVSQPPTQPPVFMPLQPLHAPSPRPSARTNSWTQEPVPSLYAQGAPIGYVSGAPSFASMPPGSPAAAMANAIPTTLVGSAHISPSTSSYGVIPAASSTTPSPLLQPGDKHEVEPGASGDPSNFVTGAQQVATRSNRTATGGVSSSSLLASPSSNPAATGSSSGPTPASGQSQGDTTPPLSEILSPTLANAQLILQQSQQHAPPRALPVHHQPLVAAQYRPMPPHPQYQIQPQYQPQPQPPQPLQYPVTTQAPGVPVTYTQQYWDPNAQNRG